uniref:Uncharacterized protein n=1 Tax=viral metagenome TaxID=1070528 RepID=A0A6M3LKM0_9ZZZZ
MDLKDIASAVKKFAPLLGTVIGGPIGGAAGGVLAGVASLFDKSPDDPEGIVEAIRTDPEAALKLRQFELEQKTELQRLAIQSDRMYLEDKQSARQREIEVTKATGSRDINLYILAYSFVAGFFISTIVISFLIFAGNIPSEVPQYAVFLLGSLFGTLSAGVTSVIQYFFGSSKGSSDKMKLFSNNMNNPHI